MGTVMMGMGFESDGREERWWMRLDFDARQRTDWRVRLICHERFRRLMLEVESCESCKL